MRAVTLKNSVSYGLAVLCAALLAGQIPAFVASPSLGAFFRLMLPPCALLLVSLVAAQTWGQGWGALHSNLGRRTAIAFLLPASALLGVLLSHTEGRLNLVSAPMLALIAVSYFLSMYFVAVGRGHHALALLLLCMPALDFVEWDSGFRWRLFVVQLGGIALSVKGAHLFIVSLFGVWAATRAVSDKSGWTRRRGYILAGLLVAYVFASVLLITHSHNQDKALSDTLSVLVCPLLLYVMVREMVNTKEKLYLIVYSAIAMAIMYALLAHYMSYRTFDLAFEPTNLANTYGSIIYGTGSPTLNGVLLALVVPLAISLYVAAQRRRDVLLALGVVVFVSVGQILAFNRGAQVAALVGVAFLLRKRRVALLVLALTGVLILWDPIRSLALARYGFIHTLEDLRLQSVSYSRYQGWTAAIAMVRHEPIFGVGMGNFGDFSHLFSLPYWHVSFFEGASLAYMQDAHNMFLTVAAELGLVGLGLVLLFLGGLLVDLIRGLRAVAKTRLEPLGWGLLGAYGATVVTLIAGNSLWAAKSTLGHNVLYWTLFALMGRLRWVAQPPETTQSTKSEGQST